MKKLVDICIVYEYLMKNDAMRLASFLPTKKLKLELYTIESFPIADSMIPFLLGLSARDNLVFMLIKNNSSGYFWISKELKRQHIMENCNNIYPVFSARADLPSCWNDSEQNFLTMDCIKEDVEKILFNVSSK